MEESVLRCGSCQKRYSEERVPRNLVCGHSLCTPCVGQTIITCGGSRTCPECQAPFPSADASDMVVNYPLLRLVRALATAEIDTSQESPQQEEEEVAPHLPAQPSALSVTCEADKDTGECRVHGQALSSMCIRCNVWLCQECLALGHYPPPRGQCWTLPAALATEEIKNSHLQTLASKVAAAESLKHRLEGEITTFRATREQYVTTAVSLRTVFQEVEDNFNELEDKLEHQNKDAVKKLEEIKGMVEMLRQTEVGVEGASTPQEMITVMEVAGQCLATVEKCLTQEQQRQVPPLLKMISQGKQNLRSLLEGGRPIYTSREVGGRRRWARVTAHHAFLHLHALQDGAHASNGVTVPYKTVRHLVPRQYPTIFLDVGVAGLLRGRVYVRLQGDTPRARQALLLCSGEHGASYRGSCFHRVEKLGQPWEVLHGGDYETKRGSGGRCVVAGLTHGGIYRTEVVAGLMAGLSEDDPSRLAQFYFYLRQVPGSYDNGGFGVVTSGLDTLRTAARHHPVTDSVVQDCGLVIPL